MLIPPGNGSWALSEYVNFSVSGGAVDRIVLTSGTAALESDNHAYIAAIATPEPASLALTGVGLVLVSFVGRRKRLNR